MKPDIDRTTKGGPTSAMKNRCRASFHVEGTGSSSTSLAWVDMEAEDNDISSFDDVIIGIISCLFSITVDCPMDTLVFRRCSIVDNN